MSLRAPPLFPRTSNKPLLSVLLPTRGRPNHLRQAVSSCYDLAKDKNCLEFIFKTDTDDRETIDTVEWLKDTFAGAGVVCKHLCSDRGNGYFDMHKWVNEMSAVAEGDWIFLFNDDAVIKTQDWDERINCIMMQSPWIGMEDVSLIVIPTIGRPFAQEFFCLRRKTYEILGHVSLSPHNDNWIYSVMNFLGASINCPMVGIDHLSAVIGDKTREESVEAYKTTILSITSLDARYKRLNDVRILLNHMAEKEHTVRKETTPMLTGWYIYLKDGFPNRAALLGPDANVYFPRPNEGPEVTPLRNIKEGQWVLVHPSDFIKE